MESTLEAIVDTTCKYLCLCQYICIDDLKHIAGVRKSSKLSDGNCNNWSRKKYMYVPVNYECFLL